MTDPAKGALAMIGCSTIWGLSGIYYKWLLHVPALEVIAHRTLWSMVFFGLLIAAQGRLREAAAIFRAPKLLGLLFAGACMISVNWSGFVIPIHNGWALEASLGYYILPLLAVLLGVVLLGEKLTKLQGVAVGIAALAVLILTIGLKAPPWIALLLATTFAIYGLIKRRIALGPIMSVFIEVLLVTPFALAFLIWVHVRAHDAVALAGLGQGAFGDDLRTSLLLMGAGPMTAIPLILFTYAARRISFASLGLIQYLNPSLQFLIAVFLFGEMFTQWHAITLPMIWIALTLYSISSFNVKTARPSKRQDAADPPL